MAPSRREFLGSSLALGGALLLPACTRGNAAPIRPAAVETLPTAPAAPATRDAPSEPGDGPAQRPPHEDARCAATFEVDERGALIWLYTPVPGRTTVTLFRDGNAMDYLRREVVETTVARGRTATLPVTGLDPDARYWYRLGDEHGADPGPWHTFRTAPAASADAPAHLLVGADFHTDPAFASGIADVMRSTPASFLVTLGDWPYADSPRPGALTVEEFRERHRRARLRPDMRRMLERVPLYSIYDDHEIANDWDARFREREPARFDAGLQVWDEWFPVRTTSQPPRRYRSWRWGKHVEIFLLDARLYRSAAHGTDGPDKTMLGAEQKQWLKDGLRASRATFKLLCTSVPLAHGTTDEHWNAYPSEREELLAFLRTSAISGLVAITGDQHWFAVHQHDAGLREYQFGPTQAFLRTPPAPTPGVVARIEAANFGELRVEPGPSPTLTVRARDARGALLHQDVLRPDSSGTRT